MKSKVIIIGRSNVGKSSLFNKIVEKNQALVLPEAGTTRDFLEAEVFWRDKQFIIVDTGGLDPKKDDIYHDPIIKQATKIQKQATVILFMVDVSVGVLDEDVQIIKQLRKLEKTILLVVNKCDNSKKRSNAYKFERLGLKMHLISSINGSGIGDLLDEVINLIPDEKQIEKKSDITIALIGKPNVGKSSILNSIFGEERMIVSETEHTTRDSQDIKITYKENTYTIIDTAGIRRKTKQGDEIEHLSINKSLSAIRRSDVVALIIDISKNLTSQDKRLAKEIEDTNKGLFIIANKWDLIPEKNENTINKYQEYIDSFFPSLSWAPIIFTSATENKRTKETLLLAKDIMQNLNREITENALSKFLKSCITKRKPTIGKGTRRPRLLSLKQTGKNPPSFLIEIPNKTSLAKTYEQYLINSLQEKFDFEGVSIKLTIQQREMKKEEMETTKPRHKQVRHRHRRLVTKNLRR